MPRHSPSPVRRSVTVQLFGCTTVHVYQLCLFFWLARRSAPIAYICARSKTFLRWLLRWAYGRTSEFFCATSNFRFFRSFSQTIADYDSSVRFCLFHQHCSTLILFPLVQAVFSTSRNNSPAAHELTSIARTSTLEHNNAERFACAQQGDLTEATEAVEQNC